MRPLLLVLLVACGSPQETTSQPVALPSSPSSSASTPASVARREQTPVDQVRDAIPHWLDQLARGEDEKFIDEAVVPDQLDKVLGSRSKAQLVADFKSDKHDDVVKMLTYAKSAKPDELREEGARTYVKFASHEGVRHVTFVVEGAHVWISN